MGAQGFPHVVQPPTLCPEHPRADADPHPWLPTERRCCAPFGPITDRPPPSPQLCVRGGWKGTSRRVMGMHDRG